MILERYGHEIERLGKRYRLTRSLGSGGMADVCLAVDELEQRKVAIKVIKPDELEQETLDRFKAEAANIAKLKHPNIIQVYSRNGLDWELVDKIHGSLVPYIVMEYAEGGDLHARLKRLGPREILPLEETLHIFKQLCDGVQYAHNRGIVHRDLKPHNILFRRLPNGDERAILSDFGLALDTDASHVSFARGGTPPYMAPEQFRGQPVPASDIFALGVILYQLCTGKLPFRRSWQDFIQTDTTLPPPISTVNPALPEALADALYKVILIALAYEPQRRFPGALAFWNNVQLAVISTTDFHAKSRAEKELFSNHALQSPGIPIASQKPKERVPLQVIPVGRTSVKPEIVGNASSHLLNIASLEHINISNRPPNLKNLVVMSAFLIWFAVSVSYILFSLFVPALVTVFPDSHLVSHSYAVAAIAGVPDPNQQQIKSNLLSYTTPIQSSVVDATGEKDGATPARGTLSFINGSGKAYTFGTTTPIVSSSGITVYLDAPVTVPASNPVAGTFGKATGTATTSVTGPEANIPAQGINSSNSGNAVTIINYTAFTGGQDSARYRYVQQSDVTDVVSSLKDSLQQEGQSKLRAQVGTQQALVGSISCVPTVNTDHPIGDAGINIPQVTVMVSQTCTAISYDAKGLQALTTNLLSQQVAQDSLLGQDYRLVGMVAMDTVVKSISNSTVFLNVNVKGTYAYSKLNAEVSKFSNMIKGMTTTQAIAILKRQPHVAEVSISDVIFFLPSDSGKIVIKVRTLSYLSSASSKSEG